MSSIKTPDGDHSLDAIIPPAQAQELVWPVHPFLSEGETINDRLNFVDQQASDLCEQLAEDRISRKRFIKAMDELLDHRLYWMQHESA